MVARGITEDRGEGANPERVVPEDREAVFAVPVCRQAEMASCLTSDPVVERAESLTELLAGDIPREPHAAMTSSWTK